MLSQNEAGIIFLWKSLFCANNWLDVHHPAYYADASHMSKYFDSIIIMDVGIF